MVPLVVAGLVSSALDAISSSSHKHGPAKKDNFDHMLSQLQQNNGIDDKTPGSDGTKSSSGTE